MLPALRRRVVFACLVTGVLVFIATILGLAFARILKPPDENFAVGVAVAVLATVAIGAAAAFALTALAFHPSTDSMERLMSWAHQLAVRPISVRRAPSVETDFDGLLRSVNEVAQGLVKQLEAAESERSRLGAVVARMPSGVIVLDASERVELINVSAAELLDSSVPRAEGRKFVDVARDHELVAITRSCFARGPGGAAADPPPIVDLGHPRRHIQVIANAIGTSLGDRRVLLMLQDVTQLTEANIIRRDLVANISHELRTPIAGLKAVAETLEAGALDDPPAAREFVAQILGEVDRLAELVEELLELARLESGRVDMPAEPLDLVPLVQRAAGRLEARALRDGVALEVHDPGLPLSVTGDEARLERVFINLIDNALKFTSAEGRIDVRFETQADAHLVAVTDTGAGIPADDLPRVFERFYKSDRSRASEGSGLGLAIAKHTIQAHGGKTWVDSIEGKGATFYVSLPARR
jgi:two-component system, OmpR family, phosphate regulon sensor histidine kinase PhoR